MNAAAAQFGINHSKTSNLSDKELDDLLVEALLSGEPTVFPGAGDDELEELLNPNSDLRGKAWFDALEVIAARAGAGRATAHLAPAAAFGLADVEADVAETLAAIRRDLPGIRIVAIPEHRFVEALTRKDDPLRDEVSRLLAEAGFDAEEAAEQLESALDLNPYGLAPRAAMGGLDYDRDTSMFKPSERMWGVVYLSSGIGNDGRPLFNGDGAADRPGSARPGDLEASVAFVNDHEFAHLVTEHLVPGWPSEASRDRYYKENIADAVAIMRSVQRWGPERAEALLREVVGMRHEGLLRKGDLVHWTVPALKAAFDEAKRLHEAGCLAGLSFVDLVRRGAQRLLPGAEGLSHGQVTVAEAEDGVRWPVMNQDLSHDLESRVTGFKMGRDRRMEGEAGEMFRGAMAEYVEFRLRGPGEKDRTPVGADDGARAANGPACGGVAGRSVAERFAREAIPILNEIGAARAHLMVASMQRGTDIVDDAATGVAGVASGISRIITLDARLRAQSESERAASRKAVQALRGLELALGNAREKQDRVKAARILARSDAAFREAMDLLPERLRGLERTIESVLKDRESASRRCEAWMDGLLLSGSRKRSSSREAEI
jgi:hypothetical protein